MSTMKEMKICHASRKFQFQRGIIISSQSLPKLYEMLKNKYAISFLLTSRLNQDGLEHFFGLMRQMGGCYEYPSPVSVKHRLRSYLLGKDSTLLGEKYNSKDNGNPESKFANMTEGSFTELNTCNEMSSDCELEKELCVSAMLFSSLQMEELDKENADETEGALELYKDLGQAIEEEGLLYLGGYIAHKFPHCQLGCKIRKGEERNMLHELSRGNGRLTQPTPEFLKKLKVIENMFDCYHKGKELKPGKGAIKTLAAEVAKYTDLDSEVIIFYIRCRTFFRLRKLNSEMVKQNSKGKKIGKLLT